MRAAHVLWTAPMRSLGPRLRFALAPIERLVLAASTLLWQTHSGPVTLYTDQTGCALLDHWSLLDLWSDINTDVLDNPIQGIEPGVFWDFGKTLVLAECPLPVTLLDLDLIVWRPLQTSASVQFFHWEEIEEPWYPPLAKLPKSANYSFPVVDERVRPANTALLYIEDEDFRRRFVRESLAYATGNTPSHPSPPSLSAFLFSGQRLFSLIGASGPWTMAPFVPYVFRQEGAGEWIGPERIAGAPLDPFLFQTGWPYMHLWSFKHELREDATAASQFADKLLSHVAAVEPSLAARLAKIWAVQSQSMSGNAGLPKDEKRIIFGSDRHS
jgi:hypothetical protein